MEYDWAYLIPIIAIGGVTTYAIFRKYFKTKRAIAEVSGSGVALKAVEENAQVNRQLLAKLDSLDARLAAVEKTLTDIP